MSFLAPFAMAAGVVAALGAVLLHLLSTRRPPRATCVAASAIFSARSFSLRR